MWVSVDLSVIPMGVGISISPYIALCQKIIEKTGLDYEMGPHGTSLEGDWEEVFACVKACHEAVHQKGVIRIYTSLKVNTRIDRNYSFREKVPSVESALLSEIGDLY